MAQEKKEDKHQPIMDAVKKALEEMERNKSKRKPDIRVPADMTADAKKK